MELCLHIHDELKIDSVFAEVFVVLFLEVLYCPGLSRSLFSLKNFKRDSLPSLLTEPKIMNRCH